MPYTRVIPLLPATNVALTVGVAVGVVLGALLPVGATIATGALLGSVPEAMASGPASPERQRALRLLLFVGVLFAAGRAVGTVRGVMAGILGRRLDERLRARVMAAVNRPTGIAHLEDPALQDLMQRAQGVATGWTPGVMVPALANTASLWLQSAGSAAVLWQFHPVLAVVLFITWAVASHVLRAEYVRSTLVATGATKSLRRAGYLRDLVLVPGAGKELRIWGMVDWLAERFGVEWSRAMRPIWRERQRGDWIHAAASVAGQAVTFLSVATIGLAAVGGEVGLGALATYLGAVAGVAAINFWGDAIPLAYGAAALPALIELEQRMADAERHESLKGSRPPLGMPRDAIRFEGVTFRYPGRDTDVLRDLDLVVPAGQALAIVGANGAGKTTLVKLIARLYDPTQGRITVDGVPLTEIEPRAWQRRVSATFQEFIRYQLSARDNVAFGAVEHAADDAAVMEAARRSGALDVVNGLPHGWDTRLSREYVDGAELSGGQWQRLALARALFAASAGAGVLIMDEPTANLDVRAEAALYDRFLEITAGLTTVLISHRFSTVRRAHRIVVLADGRAVEEGSHDDLVAAGGRYAHMFALQASRFSDDADAQASEHAPGAAGG